MRSRSRFIRLMGLGTLLLVIVVGCADDVEKLARIGRRAATNLKTATDSARGSMARGLESLSGGDELQSRVETRLRWDKDLSADEIEVVVQDGIVELKGKIPDALMRQRAVEVARNTKGVEKVVDSLSEPKP